jgi:hypothetical protein
LVVVIVLKAIGRELIVGVVTTGEFGPTLVGTLGALTVGPAGGVAVIEASL